MNYVTLVGRLAETPVLEKIDDDKKITYLKLKIPRTFKNMYGEYETDIIKCVLWNGIALTTTEYCREGDVIGVRGRLENANNEDIVVVAEKVNFIASKERND